MPALAFGGLQFNLMIRGITGQSFKARPGYQFAAVRPDKPETPSTAFGWASSEGWHRFTTSVPSVATRFFWRPGILYALDDGHSFGSADVQLETQFFSTSELVGNQSVDVQPYNDNTSIAITPVTGWVPSVHIKYVKAAIVIANNSLTTMENQLYVRWADDKSAPDVTWTGIESGWNTPASGNSERNTGSLGPVTIGGSFAQFGIAVRKSSGNANRANIHVATIIDRI